MGMAIDSKAGVMILVHKKTLSDEQLLTQLPVLGMFYGGETPVGSRNGHLNDAQAAVFIMVVIMLWASMALVIAAITGAPPHTVCTVLMGLGLERHNMGLSITRPFGATGRAN
jgi:hypothetical protein